MKTIEEVEKLKREWSADPIWDIEETEGFEDYRKDLKIYRLEVENKSMRRRLHDIDDAVYAFKRAFNI